MQALSRDQIYVLGLLRNSTPHANLLVAYRRDIADVTLTSLVKRGLISCNGERNHSNYYLTGTGAYVISELYRLRDIVPNTKQQGELSFLSSLCSKVVI